MKRFILPVVAAFCLLAAPRASAQISVGGGYANYVLNQVLQDQTKATEAYNGFYLGADLMIPIYGGFAFFPGVDFTIALHRQNQDIYIPDLRDFKPGRAELKHSFLNVPLRVAYVWEPTSKVALTGFIGPTISWAFDGEYVETSSEYQVYDNVEGKKVDYSYHAWPYKSQPADGNIPEGALLKNFDVKLGVGVALDLFEHLRISVSYNLGLMNLAGPHYDYGETGGKPNDPYAVRSAKGNFFQAGVAYIF